MQRALILAKGEFILPIHLGLKEDNIKKNDSVESMVFDKILGLLDEKPKKSRIDMATQLGISERTLRNKLAKMKTLGLLTK